jgi:folate-binding protein YgfZ
MPDLGTLRVTGRDRATWLNGMVTCDLASKTAGQGAFGLSVTKTGKVRAELWIVLADQEILVGIERRRAPSVLEELDRHLIMEAAEITDASSEHAWLVAHGPLAPELVAPARELGAVAAAVDRTGTGGAAIVTRPDRVAELRDALLARAGDRGALATPEAWRDLRVELLVPEAGVDYDDDRYPQEAALEAAAVSFDKGCYLGQEAVFMMQVRGHPKQRLVQLSIEGEADVSAAAEIAAPDGAAVGQLTSVSAAPTPEGRVALGYVKWKRAVTGTELSVAGRPARVTRGTSA